MKIKYARLCALLLFPLFLPLFAACVRNENYFSRVSELRSDLFFAETEEFTITLACVSREYPYAADGIASPRSDLIEITLEGGEEEYYVFLPEYEGVGGEMSYRGTREDFYYSQSVKSFPSGNVILRVEWQDSVREVSATSVKNEHTLSPEEALQKAVAAEPQTLAAMKAEGELTGEFYVRLLRRDKNYYYVGMVEKNGRVTSLLLDAETGEVLARRAP